MKLIKKLFERLKNVCSSLLTRHSSRVAVAALGLWTLGVGLGTPQARAQGVPPSGAYAAETVLLPFTTLAAGTSTNLGAGWSSILTNVTVSTTWNSSSNAFISNTNTTYSTNTVYADMPIQLQKDLGILLTQSASGAGTNVVTLAWGLNSSTIDTNNVLNVTNGQTAAGFMQTHTNLAAAVNGSFGLVRIINISWTAASATLTNNAGQFNSLTTNNVPGLVCWGLKRNVW